ncbi:DUF1648 domain-containing protein [Demequina pelophila]|uniref:DUF1648 domain-containing protein n=1 Tax=Demequina pelophila TaxID=1638984 RepID=UPI0009E3FB74|nr:DUF1648 domain-containing protein [Demequina pelophila]
MAVADRALSRAVLVGLTLPVAVALVALALQIAMIPQLPDPVAIHWNSEGPDGFGPAWSTVLISALTTGVLPVAMAASVIVPIRRGERGFALRMMPATALFLAVMLAVMLTGSLAVQRGLDDAADAPSALPWLLGGLGAGAVAGLIGWFLQPVHESTASPAVPARPLELRAGERAVWLGHAEITRGILALILAAVGAVTLGAVAMWVVGDTAAAWLVTAIAVLLAAMMAMFTVFSVRVDREGLVVRAALGWPRFRVPIEEIASVGVIDVSGIAHFGGYGIRSIPGATGVIVRPGEALEVTRVSGRRFVVTVDDAATAAGLLEAYAEASRADQD